MTTSPSGASTGTARIEVFRPGTFTPMEGGSLSYTAADLRAIADAYDYDTAPAPIVVGHPSIDAPAFGWAKSFDYDAVTGRLYATVGDINPAFAEEVRKGAYKKVSLRFFAPDSATNPAPGSWYPKHIGFLGGAAPAVTGLKNVAFASSEDSRTFIAPFGIASFGEQGFEDTAGLFRGLRDFLIEKFGMEDADKALPAYRLEWLSETEIEKPEVKPSFAAPADKSHPTTKEPPAVKQPAANPDPAFAEREAYEARETYEARAAKLAADEAALNKRLAEIAHSENLSFAENLVNDGRLLPVNRDKLVSILDAVPAETSVSFAAGDAAVPVAKALRDLLAAQPKVVSYGALDLPDMVETGSASFAADGKSVDPSGLELHAKAEAYRRAHPGTDYLTAIRAVS